MVIERQGQTQREIVKHLMMSTGLQTCACSAAVGGSCSSSVLKLLRERVLVILWLLS